MAAIQRDNVMGIRERPEGGAKAHLRRVQKLSAEKKS